ncbi:TldD/PmbA family protein [bacterium]|nr:TldD/PmbA family protein [bacterium]
MNNSTQKNEFLDGLLTKAAKKSDAAELLLIKRKSDIVNIYNFRNTEVLSRDLEEIKIRLIVNGRIGEAFGSLSGDFNTLIDSAVTAAKFGPVAKFAFPAPESKLFLPGGNIEKLSDILEKNIKNAECYDAELFEMGVERLCDDAVKLQDFIRDKVPEILLNVYLENEFRHVWLLNTAGMNASFRQTTLTQLLMHMFEQSKGGIVKEICSSKYAPFPVESAEELIEDYHQFKKGVEVKSGKMDVIYRPSATWSLLHRLLAGVNGSNINRGISPLADKIGKQIFSDKITIYDDPTMSFAPGSVPFDDEGVPTSRKPVVENGILKNFIFSLSSGREYKGSENDTIFSTGNGFRQNMWGKNIEFAPSPGFTNLLLECGDVDYKDMVANCEEGIIVNDVIGFHSGNMLKGEYSMNVGMGAYVKDGKIVGRALNTMLAGNVYEDFHKIGGVGTKLERNSLGYTPALLFKGLSVGGEG